MNEASQPAPLLEVRDLEVHFGGGLRPVRAVDGVSFSLAQGESLALVGESGSGKSATALALARLLPEPPARYAGGRIQLAGCDVLNADAGALRRLRGGVVAYVFQEPAVALNPVLRVGVQIEESLRLHRPAVERAGEGDRLLRAVGLPDPARVARAYPHELSGGMQQRVVLAMALAGRPQLLVADEPTTALDVTVQAQVLEVLVQARREAGMAMLFITHNLALVPQVASRVLVMYAGQVIESGPAGEVLRAPRHPYTRALHRAVPRLRGGVGRLTGIPGAPPGADAWPTGCRFHPRCPLARPACSASVPAWEPLGIGGVRCPYWREDLNG